MTEYDVQAAEFMQKAKAKMTISRVGEVQGFPFDSKDMLWHYKYQVVLSRDKKTYRFTFYDSFYNWKENKRPRPYDILASVEKYEVPSDLFKFAYMYGYCPKTLEETRQIEKTHKACIKQYEKLLDFFGEELMEELREIN